MRLYLIRHGIASERIGGAVRSDADRPLTDEGKEETRLTALALRKLGTKPDLVVTSPLVRARQTAEIVAEVLGCKEGLETTDALSPGGTVSNLYKLLSGQKRLAETILVGHQPDMTRLAQALLWAGQDLDMPFKKSAVCRIDVYDLPPTSPGTLKWFITPRIAALMTASPNLLKTSAHEHAP